MVNEIKFNEVLYQYKIKATCTSITSTSGYTSYDLELLPGGKVKDIIRYSDEISLAIKSFNKPSVKVLHKDGVVRVGFAKERDGRLDLFDILPSNSNGLYCTLGENTNGEVMSMNLANNPHMIISGATGSGKSVLLHNIICNIINNKNNKLVLLDPKNVEFQLYKNSIADITVKNSFNDSLSMITYLVNVMDYRYKLLSKGVSANRIPGIVLIIDEFADLIMQDTDKEFYHYLCRLAQKCRAAKINIILATQRPTVDVINGTIKANFPARIACRASSAVDSRVVLDSKGAENLLGKGDALLKDNTRNLERFQVAYVTPEEVLNEFGKSQKAT